jgi:hypothetical protein
MLRIAVVLALSTTPLRADDAAVLSNVVRQVLVKSIPAPAVTATKNWDHQKEIATRKNFRREGRFQWKFDTVKEMKNDGLWSKVALTVVDPETKLGVTIADVKATDGTTSFTATLAGPCRFRIEQQLWKSGLRLYSGEIRGRFDAKAVLTCTSAARTDWQPGKLLPAQVFAMAIAEADLSYANLKVEHAAGLGGEAAEKIGDTVVGAVKLLKPSLETSLIEKANAAIVKAGQSKEIRLDVEKMLTGKSAVAPDR